MSNINNLIIGNSLDNIAIHDDEYDRQGEKIKIKNQKSHTKLLEIL